MSSVQYRLPYSKSYWYDYVDDDDDDDDDNNKKAVLSQGNRAMPQLFFSV